MNYQLTINSPIGDDILYGLSPDLTIAGITVVQPGRAFPYEDADETIPIAPGKTYRVFYRTFDEDWTEANSQTITVPGNILINTGGTSEAVHLTITEPVGPGYTYGLSATGTIAGISVQQDDPTFFFSDSFGTPLLTGQTYRVFYKEYGGAWSLDNSVLIALSDQIGVDGEQIVASVIALTDVPLENTVTELAHFRTRTLPDGRTVRELVYTPLTDGETDIDLIPGEVDDFEQIYEDEKSLWLTNPEQNGFGGVPLSDKVRPLVPFKVRFDSNTNPSQKRCYLLALLPDGNDLGNYAHVYFRAVLGGDSATQKSFVEGWIANRDEVRYSWQLHQSNPAGVGLRARKLDDGRVLFYLIFESFYGEAEGQIFTHQAYQDPQFEAFDESGDGVIVFDTRQPETFPPSLWLENGVTEFAALKLRNPLPVAGDDAQLVGISGGSPVLFNASTLRARTGALKGLWFYDPTQPFRPARYRRIIALPAPGAGIYAYDRTRITLSGGASQAGQTVRFDIRVVNVSPLEVQWEAWGQSPDLSAIAVVAYRQASGETVLYLHFRTDDFVSYEYEVESMAGFIDYDQTEVLIPPGVGFEFNTAEPATYPPLWQKSSTTIATTQTLVMKDAKIKDLKPLGSNGVVVGWDPETEFFGKLTVDQLATAVAAKLAIAPPTPSPGTAPQWPALPPIAATEGTYFSQMFPAPTDAEGGTLTITVVGAVPAGVTVDTTGRLVYGTPVKAGNYSITLRATDPQGNSSDTVQNVNVAAVITVGPLQVIAPAWNPTTGSLTIQTSGGNGSAIEYQIAGLRGWGSSPVFTVPDYQRNGTVFTLEARQSGVVASLNWKASSVPSGSQPPVTTGTIPAQGTRTGVFYSYTIPSNIFTSSLPLTLSAQGLPAGLTISGTTIQGTATEAVTGRNVTLRATDSAGAATQTNFLFTVYQSSAIVQAAPLWNAGSGILTLRATNALPTVAVQYRIPAISDQWRQSADFVIPTNLRTGNLITQVRQANGDGTFTVSAGTWTAPSNPTHQITGIQVKRNGVVDGMAMVGIRVKTSGGFVPKFRLAQNSDGFQELTTTFPGEEYPYRVNYGFAGQVSGTRVYGVGFDSTGRAIRIEVANIESVDADWVTIPAPYNWVIWPGNTSTYTEGGFVLSGGTTPTYSRIGVIGNSILQHAPLPELGWNANRGMAASADDKDMRALLRAYARTKNPSAEVVGIQANTWEATYATNDLSGFNAYRSEPLDILVVRLGENVNDADVFNNKAQFKQKYVAMVNYVLNGKNIPVVVTTSLWDKPNTSAAIREIATENNYRLVELETMRLGIPANNGYYALDQMQYTDQAVRNHPNDAGMQEIVNRLIPKIWTANTTPPALTTPYGFHWQPITKNTTPPSNGRIAFAGSQIYAEWWTTVTENYNGTSSTKNWGGSLNVLKFNNGINYINHFDTGRQLQDTVYGGPDPHSPVGFYKDPAWAGFCYNPIEAGDWAHNASEILEYGEDPDTGWKYIAVRAKSFPLTDFTTGFIFKKWQKVIAPNVIRVYKLIEWDRNNDQVPVRDPDGSLTRFPAISSQERPVFYANDAIYNAKYANESGIQTEDLRPYYFNGPNWRGFRDKLLAEPWWGLTGPDGTGAFIIGPKQGMLQGGIDGGGEGGPWGAKSTYLANTILQNLDPVGRDYSTYDIYVGTAEGARAYAAQYVADNAAFMDFTPNYDFRQGARHGWSCINGILSDENTGNAMVVQRRYNNEGLTLKAPLAPFNTSGAPMLYIRVKNNSSSANWRLAWIKPDQTQAQALFPGLQYVEFAVPNDGDFHTIALNMANPTGNGTPRPGWTGIVTELYLAPVTNPGSNANPLALEFFSKNNLGA